jgi:hypothetical protein
VRDLLEYVVLPAGLVLKMVNLEIIPLDEKDRANLRNHVAAARFKIQVKTCFLKGTLLIDTA